MYFVYLLTLNDNDKRYYIGSTPDIKKRISEHQNGKSEFTKKYLPAKLLYFEGYPNKTLALSREKNLKKFGSAYYGLLKRLRLK